MLIDPFFWVFAYAVVTTASVAFLLFLVHRSENQSSVLIDHLRTRLSRCEDRVKRLEDELSRIKEKPDQLDIGVV